jgi:6,7-dimethyl-8-ribityllumazine synthase
MSAEGAPSAEPIDAAGLRVTIVAASWHAEIMDGLLNGAVTATRQCGVDPITVRVPGSFELPVVSGALTAQNDALIALGVVIRGGTPHFDYVCQAVTHGLTRVTLDSGVPVGFGVLTCDDERQALDRAGLPNSREDKGREAALAAIHTAVTLRTLASGGPTLST